MAESTEALTEALDWIERDHREPDKVLCNVASARRRAFDANEERATLKAEIARLRQGLWDCAREADADQDGDRTSDALMYPDIVEYALREVRELHNSYDEALGELNVIIAGDRNG